jgi:hypothetical protein
MDRETRLDQNRLARSLVGGICYHDGCGRSVDRSTGAVDVLTLRWTCPEHEAELAREIQGQDVSTRIRISDVMEISAKDATGNSVFDFREP